MISKSEIRSIYDNDVKSIEIIWITKSNFFLSKVSFLNENQRTERCLMVMVSNEELFDVNVTYTMWGEVCLILTMCRGSVNGCY